MQLSDLPGRHAADEGHGLDVPRHHSTRSHGRPTPHAHPRENHRVRTDPAVVLDDDRLRAGRAEGGPAVLHVEGVRTGADPDARADERTITDPNGAVVVDGDPGVVSELCKHLGCPLAERLTLG